MDSPSCPRSRPSSSPNPKPLFSSVIPPLHYVLSFEKSFNCVIFASELFTAGNAMDEGVTRPATKNQARSPSAPNTPQRQVTDLHNHATEPSIASGCHFLLRTFACVERGMRWWYVSGTSRSQISHSCVRVDDHTGGGAHASSMYSRMARLRNFKASS